MTLGPRPRPCSLRDLGPGPAHVPTAYLPDFPHVVAGIFLPAHEATRLVSRCPLTDANLNVRLEDGSTLTSSPGC